MSYLAMYRRFRPKNFDELIGQEHVVRILKNQIRSGRIGHAYLFCGARGTGKTTVAKVFARAINCLSPVDGSPCGKCEVCKEMEKSSNMDILELDAASNNGVDDIRDMREKIKYPPVVGKYKVYIVDEVHMLSIAAFNALLKTLEEPPAHAVFIFATTEVHKLPRTILSRCMRFDFRLIETEDIAKLIKRVLKETGNDFEEEAAEEIARAGEGSARDALSVAETCASFSQGKITYADVIDVIGAADYRKINSLLSDIIDGRTGDALAAVDELAGLGKSMSVLADDIASAIRDVIVCGALDNPSKIIAATSDKIAAYKAIAAKTTFRRLLRLLEIFTTLDNAFRYSTHPRIVIESAIIRAARPEKDYDIDALLARMTALENAVAKFNLKRPEYRDDAAETVEPSTVTVSNVTAPTVTAPTVTVPAPQPVARENAPRQKAGEEVLKGEDGGKNASAETLPENKKVAENAQNRHDGGEFGSLSERHAMREELDSLPEVEVPAPKEMKAEPIKEAEPEKVTVPPAKLWGNVLKTLRSNGNAVLWTVCRDVEAHVLDGTLVITVDNEGEYTMFTRADHYTTLCNAAAMFGDYKVKIERGDGGGNDEFLGDIQKLKDVLGDDVVKIK